MGFLIEHIHVAHGTTGWRATACTHMEETAVPVKHMFCELGYVFASQWDSTQTKDETVVPTDWPIILS